MLELLTSPDAWASLATLTALELVLGVDNIVFISILAGKLPETQRGRARSIGLAGAFVTRIGLLAALSWLVKLDQPWFEVAGRGFSGKSLILLGGGVFLIYKATKEIHHKLEADEEGDVRAKVAATLAGVVAQIMLMDMVFSIDSVITAVGMTDLISVMIVANMIALVVMLLLGRGISAFVERHVSVKVLALSFLLMIGLVLVAEGFGVHVPKGYIYGAMAFSMFVELLNLRAARKRIKSR